MSLKQNQLFYGLTGSEIDKILPMIRLQTIRAGSVIIEEGQSDKILYVLISGQVEVVKIAPDGSTVAIARRQAGDFFGEMALLEDAPRSARIVATEPCEVGLIDDIAFSRMLEQEPRIAVNLLKSISMRLRQTSDQIIEQFNIRVAEQKKQIDRLHQLVEISKMITERMDRRRLLEIIPAFIQKQIPDTTVLLMLADETAPAFLIASAETALIRILPFADNPFSAFQEKNYISEITDFRVLQPSASAENTYIWDQCRRLLLCPLQAQDHFDGWIIVKKADPSPFDENDRAYLETVASYISVVLLNIRLSAQIMMAEKLTAVGRATSSVIHDFKNFLSIVHVYAQMIPRAASPEEIKELVDKILASSNMMIAMSREILSFIRGEITLNRTEIPVSELLANVLAMTEQELQKRNITLIQEIPDTHRYAFDIEKMSRAVYNLLKNAAESIEQAGGVIRVSSIITGNELTLTISDNGVGIPESVLQNLFTPFVTTKPEGTGLGMLIVKNIIEAHGGQIDIESRQGQGTDVLLTFPLKDASGTAGT